MSVMTEGRDVEMCKLFSLEKTLNETLAVRSRLLAHRYRRFEPITVLRAFHTIQPPSYYKT